MTDADKLARYEELANLAEELHDENMAMCQQLAATQGSLREHMREIHKLRQQLAEATDQIAAAVAACKQKDALAIQPDDSALKAWLDEPVAWMNVDPRGGALFFRNDVCHVASTPLYAPKGLK